GTNLGKDCYKVRMAITSKGRGRSGGARVITCVRVVKTTVFLLTIYDKSESESIRDKELERLIEMIGQERRLHGSPTIDLFNEVYAGTPLLLPLMNSRSEEHTSELQ